MKWPPSFSAAISKGTLQWNLQEFLHKKSSVSSENYHYTQKLFNNKQTSALSLYLDYNHLSLFIKISNMC